MKKFVYLISAAALMTSCAETELDTLSQEVSQSAELGQGISFSVVDGPASRAQWDYETGGLGMFWHSESDKLDIYVKNAKLGKGGSNIAEWNVSNKTTYKATRSLNKGYFTADGNNNVIYPTKTGNQWNAPEFIFVWPSSSKVAFTANEAVVTLPAINAQDQTDVKGTSIVKNSLMVGTKKVDTSVIEDYTTGSDLLVDMRLERTMPLLGFYVKGYDAANFGNLLSITLESLGEIQDDKTADGKKMSVLDYGSDATWNVNDKTYTVGTTDTKNSVTLKINGGDTGLEWGNGRDFTAFMTVAPVDRSKMKNGERMKVTYLFKNIEVVREIDVTQTWEAGHHFYATVLSGEEGFDLQKAPYLLFAKTSGSEYLQLNSTFAGGLSSIIKDGEIDGTDVSLIRRVVSNVALTDEDFKLLGENFTGLEELVINENTSIPAFESKASKGLEKLTAPKVTEIAEGAFKTAGGSMNLALTECILPAYEYKNAKVAAALLKAEKLVKADLSSVSTIAPQFPAIGITFQDFEKLTTVTLKNGVELGSKAFANSGLTTINYAEGVKGSIKLVGSYALQGTDLTAVSVSNTVIPEGSFSEMANLVNVNNAEDTPIVPTEIGARAFYGTKITDIDLSKASVIGEAAFHNCKSLVGTLVPESGVKALYVKALVNVPKQLFEGCTSLKYVSFESAETVDDAFMYYTKPVQIEFKKAITYAGKSSAMTPGSFGGVNEEYDIAENTTLFVNGSQTGVNGATLTIGKTAFTFKAIK